MRRGVVVFCGRCPHRRADPQYRHHYSYTRLIVETEMSLKFGVYLVEQRIVSPEQFCGLVKIQQESVRSLAKISLERNMLTIRQVANILDTQGANAKGSSKPFHQLAVEMNYLSTTEADKLLKAQESTGASINGLLVECGLLTESQSQVLYSHFQRTAYRAAQKVGATPVKTPATPTPASPPATRPRQPNGPRQPNFKRRPVIIQNRQVQI